jgi:hypothetical protein
MTMNKQMKPSKPVQRVPRYNYFIELVKSHMMEGTHPYRPSVRPFSSQDVQFEAGREQRFPAEFWEFN